MNPINKIFKNISNYLIGQILYNLIGFIILIFVARYLGSEEYGKYSFIITFLFFFEVFSSLGINMIVVREISKNKTLTDKIISNGIILKTVLSVIAIIVAVLLINFMGYPTEIIILVAIASVTVLFSSIRAVSASIFQVENRIGYLIIGNLSESIVFGVISLIGIFLNLGLYIIIFAYISSKFAGFITTIFYSKKLVNYVFKFDVGICRNLLFESIPVGITVVLRSINYRIGIIMLSSMRTITEVGIYSAAFTIATSLSIIPISFMFVLYPLISEYAKFSREKLIKIYETSFRLMIVISIPIAINIAYFSEDIIRYSYGLEFLPAAVCLSILIWSQVFAFLNSLFHNIFVSIGKQKISAYIALVMTIFAILFNYFLIPIYGYIGTSVAMVLTEALGTILGYIFINNFLVRQNFMNLILKVLLVNILLLSIIHILNFLPFYILILIYSICYIILIVNKEEMNALKSVFKNKYI